MKSVTVLCLLTLLSIISVYSCLKVLVLTDIHLSIKDLNNNDKEVTTEDLLVSLLNKVKNTYKENKPDVIIINGDNLAHGVTTPELNPYKMTVEERIKLAEKTFSIFIKKFDENEYFNGIKILPSVGNNDSLERWSTPNKPKNTVYYKSFIKLIFRDNTVTGFNEDLQKTLEDGFYYSFTKDNVKLISLNSLYFTLNNTDNSEDSKITTKNILAFLRRELENCINKCKAVVYFHVPPVGNINKQNKEVIDPMFKPAVSSELENILLDNRFKDILEPLIVSGKHHAFIFSLKHSSELLTSNYSNIKSQLKSDLNEKSLKMSIQKYRTLAILCMGSISPYYKNSPNFQSFEITKELGISKFGSMMYDYKTGNWNFQLIEEILNNPLGETFNERINQAYESFFENDSSRNSLSKFVKYSSGKTQDDATFTLTDYAIKYYKKKRYYYLSNKGQ